MPDRIDRNVVRQQCLDAAASPSDAVDAFVTTMIWGYGSVGYGSWRVSRIFGMNPNLPERLWHLAGTVAVLGGVAAYRALATDRVRFLGPAFGTKYLSFVPQHDRLPPALIHDAVVARAIEGLGGPRWSPLTWSSATYERYVLSMSRWAADLNLSATDLEWILFGSRASGQWASILSVGAD